MYIHTAYWLVLCVNLTQAEVIREEGASVVETPHEIQLWSIFSIGDQWGRAQPMVGGAISRPMVLVSIEKRTEQVREASQ